MNLNYVSEIHVIFLFYSLAESEPYIDEGDFRIILKYYFNYRNKVLSSR